LVPETPVTVTISSVEPGSMTRVNGVVPGRPVVESTEIVVVVSVIDDCSSIDPAVEE
jgi:hypothetical protein